MPIRKQRFRVLGIDPGTNHTGFAIVDHDFDTQETNVVTAFTIDRIYLLQQKPWLVETYGERETAVLGYADVFRWLLDTYSPDAVITEAPFMGRFPKAFAALVELVTSFRNTSMTWDCTIAFQTVQPTAVKKSVGAVVSRDKNDMRNAMLAANLLSDILLEDLDEHAVDAVCVCLHLIKENSSIINT